MADSKSFKVILKKGEDVYVKADKYEEDRSARYIFYASSGEVAAFQMAEVVAIVDTAHEEGADIAFA